MADINANSIKDVKSFNNVSVVAVAVTGAAIPLQPQIPGQPAFAPVATPPASPGEPSTPAAAAPAASPGGTPIPKDYDDESLVFAAIMEKAGLYSLQVCVHTSPFNLYASQCGAPCAKSDPALVYMPLSVHSCESRMARVLHHCSMGSDALPRHNIFIYCVLKVLVWSRVLILYCSGESSTEAGGLVEGDTAPAVYRSLLQLHASVFTQRLKPMLIPVPSHCR